MSAVALEVLPSTSGHADAVIEVPDVASQDEDPPATARLDNQPIYSVFPNRQRLAIVYIASFIALISPLSSTIYYPALPTLAKDLHVSQAAIQLSITVYQIFQALAPAVLANFSDSYGRKPAYAICLVLYLSANIGLALQNSYASLMVLRCLQSCGSAVTVPLGAGVVTDITTRAERGKFIAYASMAITLGPALGPVVGGLLTEHLGWRSIFWFLTITAGLLFPIYFLFVPETARSIVGDGSIVPPRLFMTASQHIRHYRASPSAAPEADRATLKRKHKRLNLLAPLKILGEKEGGVTVGFGSLMFGGYFMILTTFPAELTRRFGYNAVQVGLCYLPVFVGGVLSRSTVGWLLDRNFRRHARKAGVTITRGIQPDMDAIPIEAARLQISIPMIYITSVCVIAYGWTMQTQSSIASIEVALFFLGLFNAGGMTAINTLVVDTHQESPATAMAANNLFRCLVSAGGVAVALPLIDRIGIGWTSVFIAGVWLSFSPCLWLVLIYGGQWRRAQKNSIGNGHTHERGSS